MQSDKRVTSYKLRLNLIEAELGAITAFINMARTEHSLGQIDVARNIYDKARAQWDKVEQEVTHGGFPTDDEEDLQSMLDSLWLDLAELSTIFSITDRLAC